MLDLPGGVPPAFGDMVALAARYDASLAVFDAEDRVRYVSPGKRRLYPFLDYSRDLSFADLVHGSWQYGVTTGEVPSASNPDDHLAYALARRLRERLEFTRTCPVPLICSHLRLPTGWSAQLRVEPRRVGLEHWFAPPPTTGLVEAIRQMEEAGRRAAALDCLAFGVAVIGPDCRVSYANAAMLDLMSQQDGFRRDDAGRLVPSEPREAMSWARAVSVAALHRGYPPALAISARTPGEHHLVTLTPSLPDDTYAVVAVAPARVPAAEVLEVEFGLSPSEALLAARLGDGVSNKQATADLGKSAGRGRVQLHGIFRKIALRGVDVSDQVGVGRWVLALAAITGAARLRGLKKKVGENERQYLA